MTFYGHFARPLEESPSLESIKAGRRLDRLDARGEPDAVESLAPVGKEDFRDGREGQARDLSLWMHDLVITPCGRMA